MSEPRWRGHNWRYCFRHFRSNYRKFCKKDALAGQLYHAACQWEPSQLDIELRSLFMVDPDHAQRFVESLGDKQRWTLAHDGGARWGHVTTNVAESINGVFKGLRSMPVAALVQGTLYRCIRYFDDRHKGYAAKIRNGEKFTDACLTMVATEAESVREYNVKTYDIDAGYFEVEVASGISYGQSLGVYRVDIKNNRCDCNKFQGLHIPCTHAIAACANRGWDHRLLIHQCYTNQSCLDAYAGVFYPVGDRSMWPVDHGFVVWPPQGMKRGKGRPNSTRILNDMDFYYDEGGAPHRNRVRCSKCGLYGHNKRGCRRLVGGS